MAAVTVPSDFGAQENKICYEVMGPDTIILVFWMLSFKPAFSLSSFTLIKRKSEVTEESKREIKKFLETNDSENTTPNLWDAAKAFPRGKFIAIQSYLKKQEKHQIDKLTLHLKQLEKEGKNSKINRRKETIKIPAEMKKKWKKQ